MNQKIYEESFSGYRIRYRFRYSGTKRYMAPYLKEAAGSQYDIQASTDYIDWHRPFYTEDQANSYIEYKSLIGLTSQALLPRGACIMHAVAVKIHGYCWLITAPSGTGKTTQYYHLKSLYGNKVSMICGDMPLLEWTEDGKITVHPSPWNGKERIKGRESAPLGGILFLRQGQENMIRRIDSSEAVIQTLLQLAFLPDTEEEALHIANFADRLLRTYPIWEMVNLGDPASARLAAETFLAYLEESKK